MKTQPWVIACLVVVLSSVSGPAAAQSAEQKFEVGGHVSALRIGDAGNTNTNAGIGGRVSYDVFRWLAVDGQVDYFPKDRLDVGTVVALGLHYSRRRLEGFVGPKVGVRRERFGLFGTVRPGFTHLTNTGMGCTGEMCALALFMRPEYQTEFALNYGGIMEVYPTSRAVVRFDVGSTAFRHRSIGVPPCRECTTQNFASSVGMGFRF